MVLQDEVTSIRSEIQSGLDCLMEEPRAALSQRLNFSQSGMRHISPEILSYIFHHACLPVNKFYDSERKEGFVPDIHASFVTQLRLGAVSTHWRNVAWSTPQLWTSIDINTRNIGRLVGLLRLFLINSRDLPLTISLSYNHSTPIGNGLPYPEGPFVHSTIDDLLETNLHRVARLWLDRPLRGWLYHVPRLSQLSECYMISPLPEDLADNFFQPCLAEIVSQVELHWPSITTLHLRDFDFPTSIKLLAQCPNLISYHLTGLAGGRWTTDFRDPEETDKWFSKPYTITLQHLRDFSWLHDHFYPWSGKFLQNLRLPALRSLHWTGFHDRWGGNATDPRMHNFLQSFSSTLETLELEFREGDEMTMIFSHFLGPRSPIKDLKLINPPRHFVKTMSEILQPRVFQGVVVTKNVPELQSFTIKFLCRQLYDVLPHPAPDVIMKIFDGRWRPVGDSNAMFRLNFYNVMVPGKKYREMAKNGLRYGVEVYSDSELVTVI